MQGPEPPTTNTASLDGALTPNALAAWTRTKYVPAGTPPTDREVAALPVEKLARIAQSGRRFQRNHVRRRISTGTGGIPSQRDGRPAHASDESAWRTGVPGVTGPTLTTTSFEGGLVPTLFVARTRTKKVP